MKQARPQPVKIVPCLSEEKIMTLMMIIGQKDGVAYTSFTWLNFSRPAVCLKSAQGEQRIITVDNAKHILSEEVSHD